MSSHADVVILLTAAASEEYFAFVFPGQRDRDASVVIGTDRMLAAFYDVIAFVVAGAVSSDTAVIVVADHMLLRTILVPCTIIGTSLIDLDAGVVLADGTLVAAAEPRIARIIARAGKNDAFHALTY